MSLDPISLGVQVGRLRAVCDEMGAVLIRSAHSPNIKERRDCSTALFEPRGELVMQAEHIPVHLGSMPDAVASILDEEQRPGESWILNDPFRGGTHLPDITLDHARLLQRGPRGLRRQPRASRGCRRADAGVDALQLTLALRGGRCDPAHPPRRSVRARGHHSRDAEPPAAGRGPPRAAGGERPGSPQGGRPDRRRRAGRALSGNAGDPRLLRAPHPGAPRRTRGRRMGGKRHARGRARRVGGHRTSREGHHRRR